MRKTILVTLTCTALFITCKKDIDKNIPETITSTKEILDFRFTPASNNGLATEAIGEFLNDSTIIVRIPQSLDLRTLVPSITHNGKTITSANGQARDFRGIVYYSVMARDSSTRSYGVMLTSNKLVYIGTNGGDVFALDAATGVVKWQFSNNRPMGSPIHYQGKLFVAAQGGLVYCLDPETGAVEWTFSDQVTNYSTPCIYNGKVFIGYYNPNSPGTGIYAFDASGGNLLWKKPISSGNGLISNPTAVNSYVMISDFTGGTYVLNASNGSTVSVYNSGLTTSNPLVSDGIVYTGGEGSLMLAFQSASGNLLWTNNTASNTKSSPVISNNILYAAGDKKMYALNKSTGAIIWSQDSYAGSQGQSFGRFSSPVISQADTALYVGSDENLIYSLDLNTGQRKWLFPGGTPIFTMIPSRPSPVYANGMVITNRADNSLYALAAKNGSLLWKFTAPSAINSDPCILDNGGITYYTSNAGNLN